jgi:hypothetical protein
MAHYLFNFSGHRDAAATLLRAKMWGIGTDERHRDALAPGDLILIYLAPPERAFVGRAELASAARVWMPSEDYPGDSPSGVLLSHVEEWDPPVPMDAAVARIDPAGVNPYVQANRAGFRAGVVRISSHEYETVLAMSRETPAT